jgi:hypothetical protein
VKAIANDVDGSRTKLCKQMLRLGTVRHEMPVFNMGVRLFEQPGGCIP